MLPEVFALLFHRFPDLKGFMWRQAYQFLSRKYDPDWTFINYGLAPVPEDENGRPPPVDLHRADKSDRFSIQLYHHLAAKVPIEGRRVLEIGSGRGGGRPTSVGI